MPRKPSVPMYRLHKATGQAAVTIHGRHIYLGPHGSAESKAKYRAVLAEWASSAAPPTDVVLVARLVDAFMKHAEGYYVRDGIPTGETDNFRYATVPLVELYGKTPVNEFSPKRLKAVRQEMIDSGRLTRSTINARINRIRRIFKWGVSEEMVTAEVLTALQAVPGLTRGRSTVRESKTVKPVPDEIIEATLEHLPEVVADMVRLQRLTGMRPGEVVQVRPCDIDRSEDVWKYRPEHHKTEHHGHSRVVAIGPRAQSVLLKYLVRAPEMRCFRPIDSEAKRLQELHARRKTPLSCGNAPGRNRKKSPQKKSGEAYTVANYRQAISRAARKANVPGWTPNQLRHTAATEFRRQFGLEQAQVVLGHKKADVTQVYAERDHRLACEVATKIG